MSESRECGQVLDPAGATEVPPPGTMRPLQSAPIRADVERDQAANEAKLQHLAAQGVQVDLASMLRVRFNELLEQLLGDMDSPARLEHERRCNARYATMIADVEAQVARARLLQGVQLGGGNGRPT